MEYMTAKKGNRFDFASVWWNQTQDVHPPFYYALLHTVCSLLPGTFSKWYAGMINMMFAIFTLYVLRKTVWLMSSDDFFAAFVSNIYWFRRYFIIGYML